MSLKRTAITLLVTTLPLLSQSERMQSLAFEVASIKLHIWQSEPRDPANVSGRISISGSRVTATAESLSALVIYAYDAAVSGEPGWAKRQFYDINAKAAGEGPLTVGQSRLMFQQLLADRFRVKIHRENREMSSYALVVAKGGPKFNESAPDSVSNFTGTKGFSLSIIRGIAVTTPQLAESLSREVGRPVVDQTGLKGQYDLELRWTRDVMTPGSASAPLPPSAPPPLLTAIQEQLGLKMEATKGVREIVVIDQAEEPTEN